MSAPSLSGSCLNFFREQLPLQQYNSWIKPLIFEIDGDKLVLTAPNSFTLRIVQERFLPEITGKQHRVRWVSKPLDRSAQRWLCSFHLNAIFARGAPTSRRSACTTVV